MARPSTSYEPRRPASVVHRIVQDHLETLLAEAARMRDGEAVPPFVERACRDFLRCGFLAGGFARFRRQGPTARPTLMQERAIDVHFRCRVLPIWFATRRTSLSSR